MNARPASLKTGIVSPYPWTSSWGVNRHVRSLAHYLEVSGHDVSIIVPADERRRPAGDSGLRLLRVRGTFRFPYSDNLANLALPMDITDRLDTLLGEENFDLLHVHEPYPPSLSFTALRLAHSPVVATFHTTGERFLSFQLMRPVVERFFNRLDGRICASESTRRIVSSYFPGDYDVVASAIDVSEFHPESADAAEAVKERPQLVFAAWSDARKGMALLGRMLRLLPSDVPPFDIRVIGARELSWRKNLLVPRRLRQRIGFRVPASTEALASVYRQSDIVAAPYATAGQATAVLEAMACGCAAIVPAHGGLKEIVKEGSDGFLLDHPYSYNLAAVLMDLLANSRQRESLGRNAARRGAGGSWEKTGPRLERLYARAYRRRRSPKELPGPIELLNDQKTILADLHMHTNYSSDCQTTPAELLAASRESGLEAIAVTDHNCIDGALEVARLAPPEMHVIVGEEIKTCCGEIIGLYLSEEIPRGLTLEETIARIRQQGGLVYVPHPFDPLHKTPAYDTLARNAADIDVIEVYNPRITFSSFNDKARVLARKYDIPGAAGSDCHVAAGVGTAMISLRRFSSPQELLLSLREADIIKSGVSPIYLHSLKLLRSGKSPPAGRP